MEQLPRFLNPSHLPLVHPDVERTPRIHRCGAGQQCSPPLVMLLYAAGVNEDIRQVCRRYGIR